ncbi:hypothetical protein Ancab_001930 [Ancistrocladus abbreviatus]
MITYKSAALRLDNMELLNFGAFMESYWDSFSFSYRSPRPCQGRVNPSEAAESTAQLRGEVEVLPRLSEVQGVNSDLDRIALCVPSPSDRVKSTKVMQIHRPLPLLFWMNGVVYKALSNLWSLGAKDLAGSMGPLTSSYVLCGYREANEGKPFELMGELTLTLSLFDW